MTLVALVAGFQRNVLGQLPLHVEQPLKNVRRSAPHDIGKSLYGSQASSVPTGAREGLPLKPPGIAQGGVGLFYIGVELDAAAQVASHVKHGVSNVLVIKNADAGANGPAVRRAVGQA